MTFHPFPPPLKQARTGRPEVRLAEMMAAPHAGGRTDISGAEVVKYTPRLLPPPCVGARTRLDCYRPLAWERSGCSAEGAGRLEGWRHTRV